MCLMIELLEPAPDCFMIFRRKLPWPVILIPQPPNDDRRMVVVLVDHVAQHSRGLLFPPVISSSGAAPGDLLPHQQPELIALLEHDSRLLVVTETYKVRAHFFDQPHLLPNQVFGHRCPDSRMIFMPLRAFEEQAFAVELEWTVHHEFETA